MCYLWIVYDDILFKDELSWLLNLYIICVVKINKYELSNSLEKVKLLKYVFYLKAKYLTRLLFVVNKDEANLDVLYKYTSS